MTDTDDPVVAQLLTASDRAAASTTMRRAIAVAWSTLHAQGPEVMQKCLRKWADAENLPGHPMHLGGVLRRRYNSPAEIAASLRQAGREEQ